MLLNFNTVQCLLMLVHCALMLLKVTFKMTNTLSFKLILFTGVKCHRMIKNNTSQMFRWMMAEIYF